MLGPLLVRETGSAEPVGLIIATLWMQPQAVRGPG